MGLPSIWGWIFLLLLINGLILLVVAAVKLFRRGPQPGGPRAQPQTAQELLDGRYARGEIDTAEYEERRRTLEGGGS